MAEKPTVRVTKPALYKMVSFKGVDTQASTETNQGLKATVTAVNSLGGTLNSIAIAMEATLTEMKKSTQIMISNQGRIEKYNTKRDNEERLQNKRDENERKKALQRSRRDANAKQPEGPMKKMLGGLAEGVAKTFGNIFGLLAGIAKWLLGGFIKFAILDWMIKNPDKVKKLAKGLLAIAKFAYKITEFLVGSSLDGLVKFLEKPLSIQGFFGAIQFVLSAAPLFAAFAVLKNPKLLVDGVIWVVKNLAKSLINISKAHKIGSRLKKLPGKVLGNKYGRQAVMGAGIGVASAMAFSGDDLSAGSVAGAGVGGAVGSMAGGALAEAAGLGALAPLASAAGGFVGGAVGAGIGDMIGPIVEPLKQFFGMVGDIFNAIFDPIKAVVKDFFTVVGEVMTKVLDFIEPHLPMIKKVAGFFGTAAFLPLIGLLKALTFLLKFFAGGDDKEKPKKEGENAAKKARGGPVMAPVTPVAFPEAAEGGPMGGLNVPNINPFDPDSIQRQIVRKVAALGELMRLPLKAIGMGIISAIGKVTKSFAKFLPGPLKTMLSSMLGPIAGAFGIPLSLLGFSADKAAADSDQSARNQEKADDGLGLIGKALSKGKESVLGQMATLVGLMAEKSNDPESQGKKSMKNWDPSSSGFAKGGQVPQALTPTPALANGGWINGPMSGYPVSLDGGRSTSFIGHGLEWVGYPGRAAGGSAFVVPFNTPATKGNKGLTGKRMKEAARGGYALPFSMGGALKNVPMKRNWDCFPQYAEGGKYDFYIGDSIAHGYGGRSGMELVSDDRGVTKPGARTDDVLGFIHSAKDQIRGKTIYLSSGATNDGGPPNFNNVEKQLKTLKEYGAKSIMLGGTVNSTDKAAQGDYAAWASGWKAEEYGNKLKEIAKAHGVGFQGTYAPGPDGLHPNYSEGLPDPATSSSSTSSDTTSATPDSNAGGEKDTVESRAKTLSEALKKFASAMKGGQGEAISAAQLAEQEELAKKVFGGESLKGDAASEFTRAVALSGSMSDGGRSAAAALNSAEGGGDGQEAQYIVTPPLKANLEADPFQVSKFNPFSISQPSMFSTNLLK